MTSVSAMSDVMVDPRVTDPALAEGEPIFAHIVKGDATRSADAICTEARVLGLPVEAICGFVWVPSRDPQRHPVCPRCVQILEATP